MSNAFLLSLPTDIPWERICVSGDMGDAEVCDPDLPPKWHSSMAIFRYVPEDEYQQYPNYKVTYLKVAATITGYQPKNREVEGEISWDDLNVETIEDVESLLNEYHPCTGAILQVTVAPPRGSKVAAAAFPFFLDFQPKKRALYEMATDTKERVSRSLEGLSIGKSAGSLSSTEALDIDQGGSTSFGAQGSYAGTGGGFTASSSTQGQWGTKVLGQNESAVIRTTEESRERREGQSHTTQLSQMYNLFDAYHLGTNRAVFFIQPRPHVLEEPSGFVRGPRPVEGIQEIMLVVAQPKDQEEFCVSARLDTSHLTEIPILEHEYKTDTASVAASSPAPTNANDPNRVPAPRESISVYFPNPFGDDPYLGERYYDCWQRTVQQTTVYTPAWADYKIDLGNQGGYRTLAQSASNGSTSVAVSPDGESLTLRATATGHHCTEDGGVICLDCPGTRSTWSGSASREVLVYLKSRQPSKQVGIDQVVIITTRGLCCCADQAPEGEDDVFELDRVVDWVRIRDLIARAGGGMATSGATAIDAGGGDDGDGDEAAGVSIGRGSAGVGVTTGRMAMSTRDMPNAGSMTTQQANAVSDAIGEMLRRSAPFQSRVRTPLPYIYTDLFMEKLERRLEQTPVGRAYLRRTVEEILPAELAKRAGRAFGREPQEISARELGVVRTRELSQALRVSPLDAARFRLRLLGVELRGDLEAPSEKAPSEKAPSEKAPPEKAPPEKGQQGKARRNKPRPEPR